MTRVRECTPARFSPSSPRAFHHRTQPACLVGSAQPLTLKKKSPIWTKIDDPYRVRRYFEFCLSMRADNDVIMRQNRSSAILSAYEIIFHDYDEPMASDTFERAYMAYGLFGVLEKSPH